MKKLISRITIFALVISMILMAASCGAAKDPAEDYRELELSSVESAITAFNEFYDIDIPTAMTNDIKITISDQLVNTLGLSAYIGDIRSLTLGVDYNNTKQADGQDVLGVKLDLILGETELASAEVIIPTAKLDMLYFTLPDYTEKSLSLPLELGENANIFSSYSDILNIYTDTELALCVKELLTPMLELVTEVEKVKTDVTVSDITKECTAYTYEINEELAKKMAIAGFNELKTNERARTYMKNAGDKIIAFAGDAAKDVDVLAEMDKMLDEALTELQKENTDENTQIDTVTYNLYTDSQNNIIGREMKFGDQGYLRMMSLSDGQDIATEVSLNTPDGSFGLNGDGTLINGKLSGRYVFNITHDDIKELSDSDEVYIITLEDFSLDLEKRTGKGKITLELGQLFEDIVATAAAEGADPTCAAILSAVSELKIVCVFDSTKEPRTSAITIYAGELEIGTVSETFTLTTDYTPVIPSADSVFTAEQANEFGASINIMKILGNIQNCGLPAEILALFLGSMQ